MAFQYLDQVLHGRRCMGRLSAAGLDSEKDPSKSAISPRDEVFFSETTVTFHGFCRAQDSLRQAATAADDRTRMLRSKVEAPESATIARLSEIWRFEMENAEFHHGS
ncbi:hypothetical protein V8D89_013281 [Ganoderma adspersum]